jgi:hypothetical protein
MKKRLATAFLATAVVSVLAAPSAFAYGNPWAYQDFSSTVGYVYSPLFGTNVNAGVGSSWNEPRSSGVHVGVDQSVGGGSAVGPLQSPARILRNEYISGGGNSQTIRYWNSTYNKTYYSIYMHLSAYVMGENTTPTLSDVTAYTGNSGPSGTPYHLHWEVLDYINADVGVVYDYGSRQGLNPRVQVTTASGVTTSTLNKFEPFKNVSVNYSAKSISIDAWDSNLNMVDPFTECKIYYKKNGSASFSGPYNMTKVSGTTYRWTYTFPSDTTTADYLIIGRRTTSEAWAVYPVSYYNTSTSSSGITPNSYYKTYRINF